MINYQICPQAIPCMSAKTSYDVLAVDPSINNTGYAIFQNNFHLREIGIVKCINKKIKLDIFNIAEQIYTNLSTRISHDTCIVFEEPVVVCKNINSLMQTIALSYLIRDKIIMKNPEAQITTINNKTWKSTIKSYFAQHKKSKGTLSEKQFCQSLIIQNSINSSILSNFEKLYKPDFLDAIGIGFHFIKKHLSPIEIIF